MRNLLALAVVAAAALILSACNSEFTLDGKDGIRFACTSDADCVAEFFCSKPCEDCPDVVGRCVPSDAPRTECRDGDQDGFPIGSGCAQASLDCDDTDPETHPGADELCDGSDNDCDGEIDEEIEPQSCPLQAGVCAGAHTICVDGTFPDCTNPDLIAQGFGYPPDYEPVSQPNESCNGVDNNCDGSGGDIVDPTPTDIDPHCECIPGVSAADPCGRTTGTCTRGLRFCADDGQYGDCVEAGLGDECVTDDDCGDNGWCVEERLNANEDLFDDCTTDDPTGCVRTVCRTLPEGTACADDDECAEEEACVQGSCRLLTVGPIAELCNGEDDDCDGRIDNERSRRTICGECPFNMVLLANPTGIGADSLICMDRYEATRPDATADDAGDNELYSLPRPGALPWTGVSPDEADRACRAGGQADEDAPRYNDIVRGGIVPKRLCSLTEWQLACGAIGTDSEVAYPYGDTFMPGTCNDATLGSRLMPTGDLTGCQRIVQPGELAVFDMSGNAAEWAIGPRGGELAGGSFLDSDGENLRCDSFEVADFVPEPYGNHVGFRCCTFRASP